MTSLSSSLLRHVRMRRVRPAPASAIGVNLTACLVLPVLTILATSTPVVAQGLQPFVVAGVSSAVTRDRLMTDLGWIDPRPDEQRRLGFVLGAGAARHLAGRFYVRAELELVGRGFNGRESTMSMTYLEVPLLLDLELLKRPSRSLTASVGGTLGWEVACSAETVPHVPGVAGADLPERRTEDCRAFRTERFDWGLAAGLAYGPFVVGRVRATPAVRVISGQRNIVEEYAACCTSRNRTLEVFVTLGP